MTMDSPTEAEQNEPREAAVDITVTRIPKMTPWDRNAWPLTDLLGRPLGQITEAPSRQVFIDLNKRGHILMPKANLGPHASLDEALTEIEKHTHGVCHRARAEN
jgi:hypothetical protein